MQVGVLSLAPACFHRGVHCLDRSRALWPALPPCGLLLLLQSVASRLVDACALHLLPLLPEPLLTSPSVWVISTDVVLH